MQTGRAKILLITALFSSAILAAGASDVASLPVTLAKCAGSANQTFSMTTVAPYTLPAAVASSHGYCLQIDAAVYGATAGTAVVASVCGHNPMNYRANQYWQTAGSTLQSLQVRTPLCFGVDEHSGGRLTDCTSKQAQFVFDLTAPNGSSIRHLESSLCLSTTGILPPLPPPPPPPPPEPPNTPCPKVAPSQRLSQPAATRAVTGGLPCDVYAAAGSPCVAAHSSTRALYSAYSGPLYSVTRSSDGTSQTISTMSAGGVANASPQDAFCHKTYCSIETLFDQSPKGNHLRANHPGRHYPTNRGVNASAHPIMLSGHRVFGMKFDPGMGYRNDNTSGLAVADEAESMYAVMGGNHYNDLCCFDYGNAENIIEASSPGSMEAIYFGNCTSWWSQESRDRIPQSWAGAGPILMADIEAGMYAGNDTFNAGSSPVNNDFNTLMLKGKSCEFSLKAGDSQMGDLMVKYDGGRPTHADYNPMRKQGGLVLGTGGDNSDRALGIFYEGAMTTGYTSASTEDAIQANLVAARYSLKR